MSGILELITEKAHQRTITIKTHKAGHDKVVVEGRLIDNRCIESFLLSGEKMPVGDFHDMIVRLLVDTKDLTIEDVEVELIKVPRQECLDLKNSLSIIKGVRISKGFTQRIKSLLRQTQGCTHLRELLQAMGPAAIQGGFIVMAEKLTDSSALMEDPRIRKEIVNTLVNSCYVWRENGPEYKKVFLDSNDGL